MQSLMTAWHDPSPREGSHGAHLVDTTMLFAPRSGGVKRYLTAKHAWFAVARPGVRHTLVIPGGVNSPVRAFKAVGGTPRFVSRAQGAYFWDANEVRKDERIEPTEARRR